MSDMFLIYATLFLLCLGAATLVALILTAIREVWKSWTGRYDYTK